MCVCVYSVPDIVGGEIGIHALSTIIKKIPKAALHNSIFFESSCYVALYIDDFI